MRALRLLLRHGVRALLQGVVVVFGLFVLFGSLPGDAVEAMAVAGDLDAAQQVALRLELGLDRPLAWRFLDWAGAAAQGSFGESLRFGQPVAEMLAAAVPATLWLALPSAAGGAALAMLLVLAAALDARGGRLAVEVLNLWSIAVPTFCMGVAALLLFAVHLRWVPALGAFLLPVLILAVDNAGQLAKPLLEEMDEVAGRDHVRAARARGLSPLSVVWWHILPLAAPLGVTLGGLVLATALAGTLTMEIVFGVPGLGALVLQGIQGRDEPVVLAGLSVITLAIIAVNGMAAALQDMLDPRMADG